MCLSPLLLVTAAFAVGTDPCQRPPGSSRLQIGTALACKADTVEGCADIYRDNQLQAAHRKVEAMEERRRAQQARAEADAAQAEAEAARLEAAAVQAEAAAVQEEAQAAREVAAVAKEEAAAAQEYAAKLKVGAVPCLLLHGWGAVTCGFVVSELQDLLGGSDACTLKQENVGVSHGMDLQRVSCPGNHVVPGLVALDDSLLVLLAAV